MSFMKNWMIFWFMLMTSLFSQGILKDTTNMYDLFWES
jgi:hypothetical protein